MISHAADESGVALIITIVIVAAMTVSTAIVVNLMVANQRGFGRDRQDVLALNTAEAGLNYGLSVLAQTADPHGDAAYGANAWYPADHVSNGTTVAFDDSSGKGEWWANKIGPTTWKIYARGISPSGSVSRTVSIKVTSATQPGTTIPASQAWSKGLFVGNPGSSCFVPGGSASITISVYVKGCIKLSGSVGIAEPASSTQPSIQVYAETTISIQGNSAKIGSASHPVLSVVAPGGCTGAKGKICGASGSNVYAVSTTGPSQNLTKPTVSPDVIYAMGRWNAPVCSTGSFTFDNDTTRNTSLSTVDLFTASAYDCRVYDAAGAEVGRLAWNPSTGALIVTGTIYVDGDLRMNSNTAAGYTTPSGTSPLGATIYADGTITMNGTAALCGPPSTPSGSTCSGTWNATYGALFVVAVNHQGAADPFAVGWTANGNAYYDVAAYVVGKYKSNGSSGVTGPVITDTAEVSGSGSTTDVPNPPPSAPGAQTTSPGSTSWGAVPASWQQIPG